MSLYKSKAYLYKRYVKQRQTAAQIAKECGTTEMTITRWLHHFELIRNPRNYRR